MGVSNRKVRISMIKKNEFDNTHLTLEERQIIQTGIENNCNKVDIARTLAKDPSTIAKEIRKHRQLKPRNIFNYPFVCQHMRKCRKGCSEPCDKYEEPKCSRRDRSPGACNKCPNVRYCRWDKYFYYADKAEKEYRYTLIDSREGIDLNTKERKEIADIIVPLLKQGQSVYQILSSHKEIKQSLKTIYNYIEMGVFKDFGIDNFSLKEQVNRKQFKDKYKRRKEPINYTNRKYEDYLKFVTENPNVPTVEMDTVMNSLGGPYIQTFIFENTSFMIGFLHTEKNSVSMGKTLDSLQRTLNDENYKKLFSLILTDRGSEFEKHELFEINMETGEIRSNIFYCDPMQSSQKPHVEANHNYIRDIIPNGMSINRLTQEGLNLMFSHINSTPRKSLNDKTPYEVFEFMYGDEIPKLLNIQKIKRDEVVLKPYLLTRFYK